MAQIDYFLKLDGIEGESTDDKHKNEIAVESWSWAEVNAGTHATGGGGGAGKVQVHDFHFIMQANKATPKLMLACATGQHIKEAQLTCRKAGGEAQEYLIVKLGDVFVSSYQAGGGSDTGLPMYRSLLPYIEQDNLWSPRVPGPAGRPGAGPHLPPNWHTFILPYIEQDNLYRQYYGTQPRHPLQTLYAPAQPPRRGVPSDGSSNTIFFGEKYARAAGWHPVVGDWDGDGTDSAIGLTRQADPWATHGGLNIGMGDGSVRMLVPADHVSLNFSKIEFEYKPQNADGSLGSPVKAAYDLKANRKV
ncbi:MAG: type VI secretion system tube protein Hcp [Pirellulales bacterium]